MAGLQPLSEIAFASAAQAAATYTSQDIDTSGCRLLNVFTNVTANTGNTGTVTITIQGKDLASNTYYTLLVGTAIATVTTQRLKVGDTIAASANAIAQDYLPRTIRIQAVVATAPVTFSVGVDLTD